MNFIDEGRDASYPYMTPPAPNQEHIEQLRDKIWRGRCSPNDVCPEIDSACMKYLGIRSEDRPAFLKMRRLRAALEIDGVVEYDAEPDIIDEANKNRRSMYAPGFGPKSAQELVSKMFKPWVPEYGDAFNKYEEPVAPKSKVEEPQYD